MADSFGLKIGVEGEKEFKKALADINQSFKVLGSEMKLVSSEFDKNDKSIQALSARNNVLNKGIDAQKQKIDTLRSALQNASESFGENDKRTKNWQIQLNNAQAALNGMERELSENNKALEEAENGFDDAGNEAGKFASEVNKAADEADGAGGKLEKLGSIAKGIGVALAAAVAAIGVAVGATVGQINDCVNVYADFDDSMRQVAATMGMSAEEIAKGSQEFLMLENAAKEAGASTRYSASESAEALNYLALAGYDAEKAAETLPKVLNLAAAGGMDLATTSDLVTDAMSALGMETSELDGFIDQMAKTSQKSNTSVQQLGEAILECAGTTSTTGQQLTTVNTALGVLADNGIKGAEGGTHLRNVLLSLSSPTDKAAAQLNSLGVSVFDAGGNMRQLDDIMGDLNAALGDLTQEEKTNAISAIFNKTDISAVNALLSSTTGRFDELSGVISDCEGAAEEMAETMESGLAGTTRSFNSAVEGMQIEIGEIFSGIKQDLMSDTTDIIRNFTTTLREANGDWSKIGDAIGQALGDAVKLVSERLPQIVDLVMDVLSTLGQTIMDSLPEILEAAQSIVMSLVQGLIEALPQVLEAGTQIIATLISGIGEALPELIPQMVEVIMQMVQGLLDNLPLLLDAALQLIMGLAQGLIDSIPVLIAALPDIIQAIIDFILGAIPQIIEAGIQLLTSLVSALPDIITAIVEAIPQIIDGLIMAIIESIPLIIQAGIDLLVALIQNLPTIISTIVSAIPKIISSLVEGLLGNIDKIIMAGVQLFVSLIENLPTIIVEIVKAVPKIIEGIVKAFGSMMGSIVEIGGNIVKGLWDGIVGLASWLWDQVSGWISGIWDGICDFFGIHSPSREMAWVGEMLVKGLAGSIDDNGDEAVKAAEGMAEGITGVFDDLAADMTSAIPTDFNFDANAAVTTAAGDAQSAFSASAGPLITIQQMVVRSEDDIRRISQELYNLMQTGSRASGYILTT